MSFYFALYIIEDNKTKKPVNFSGRSVFFFLCSFIQFFLFTTNHQLKFFVIVSFARLVNIHIFSFVITYLLSFASPEKLSVNATISVAGYVFF